MRIKKNSKWHLYLPSDWSSNPRSLFLQSPLIRNPSICATSRIYPKPVHLCFVHQCFSSWGHRHLFPKLPREPLEHKQCKADLDFPLLNASLMHSSWCKSLSHPGLRAPSTSLTTPHTTLLPATALRWPSFCPLSCQPFSSLEKRTF